MKGVYYVTDNKKRIKAVQIDIKTILNYREELEDLLEGIIAFSRKGESSSTIEEVKKRLKKKGKL